MAWRARRRANFYIFVIVCAHVQRPQVRVLQDSIVRVVFITGTDSSSDRSLPDIYQVSSFGKSLTSSFLSLIVQPDSFDTNLIRSIRRSVKSCGYSINDRVRKDVAI
jgi:hypothetical protein